MRITSALRALTLATIVLGTTLFGRASGELGPTPAHAADVTTVTVHYHRFQNDYGDFSSVHTSWNLWLWPNQPVSGAGAGYTFQGVDAFGAFGTFQVPGANTQIGIIARDCDWSDACNKKDVSQDRFIDTPNQTAEVWLVQGDPTIYTSAADANAAIQQASKPHAVNAFLDGTNWVALKLTNAVDIATVLPGDLTVQDLDANTTIAATGVADLNTGATTGQSDLLKITLASAPDVTHRLKIQLGTLLPIVLKPRLVLDDSQYAYTGDDLGATYTASATTFKVWAPVASNVVLETFTGDGGVGEKDVPMTKGDHGVWSATVSGDQKNTYYLYKITNLGQTATALDPYAKGLGIDGRFGMVVDLDGTNPPGWSGDKYKVIKHQTDASIYETHVRDFSIDPSSGIKEEYRGKYLGLTQTGTRTPGGHPSGIDYLKKLGVQYVQLMPIEQISGLDDVTGGTTQLLPKNSADYNWGYETLQFQTPTGAYATDPHGAARIGEVKQMVQALHKAGIGVILDIAFHTPGTAIFDPLVPGYYYRTDYSGTVESGNGAGPDLGTEHAMVRKYVIDTLTYWVKQYHVDGFRFDWMSMLGHDTMVAVAKAVRAIDKHAVLLGEPWYNASESYAGNLDTEFNQGTQKGTHIAMFSDFYRDWLHGRVFDKTQPGYATGDPNLSASATMDANKHITGFSLQDVPDNSAYREMEIAGNIAYSAAAQGWGQNADETVNYVSSHDNQTLIDRIQSGKISGTLDAATQVKMDELMQGMVFTSQGVPFYEGGDEFLRTKDGDDNSYQGGDVENKFDWNLVDQNWPVVQFYAGIIHLRATHPAFRMNSPAMITSHLIFKKSAQNTTEFELTGHANKDRWKNIVVILNPYLTSQTFNLPGGKWNVVVKGSKAGTKTIGHASKRVSVGAYSMEVLYR